MSAAEPTRQRDLTDSFNDVIPLLLGLLVTLDNFAACAEAEGEMMVASEPVQEDDTMLTAALGLVSLRRTVRRWANHAASEIPSPMRSPPGDLSRNESLLR